MKDQGLEIDLKVLKNFPSLAVAVIVVEVQDFQEVVVAARSVVRSRATTSSF